MYPWLSEYRLQYPCLQSLGGFLVPGFDFVATEYHWYCMLLPPVGQDNLISYRSSELLTNPEDIVHYALWPHAQIIGQKLILELPTSLCWSLKWQVLFVKWEQRCLMLESMHAGQWCQLWGAIHVAAYEFHYSPTTSTCLIAIVCLSITHSYCRPELACQHLS